MASRHQGRAARILFTRTEYIEDADGFLIRQWRDPNEDWTRPEDVRAWLRGKRVIEDLRTGLEHCRPGFITAMVKGGFLRPDMCGHFWWITRKCAAKYKLEKVLGCEFPL